MYETTPTTPDPKLSTLGAVYLALGVADIGFALLALAGSVVNLASSMQPPDPAHSEAFRAGVRTGGAVAVALSLTGIPVGILSIVAGRRLAQARSYALCVGAVVLNMLPCYNTVCCGLFGIPIGIWALMMLSDASTKASFRE